MKYERGGESHSPGYEMRQDDEFGFGPILFGSTPPPSVGGDAPSVNLRHRHRERVATNCLRRVR